eukprot:TRINITY_DN538_c2_g1_i1.p1 TRINITY_DN538_c2_g1~~TRINITY_DN538_c2_g1_i1.p1  ORF type:complete len:306 (+),score=126.34 TRINITY_DN538_c2_g1_i1:64-981(+)
MSLCVPAPALCAAPCVAPCAPCVPRNNNTCNNTQRNKKGEKLITTKKPCAHNSWDNVRTKKGFVYFRCRVCEKQWKTILAKLNKCEAFAAGGCPAGDACKRIHVHLKKKSLEERFVVHGAAVLARVNLADHRPAKRDDDDAASTYSDIPELCSEASDDALERELTDEFDLGLSHESTVSPTVCSEVEKSDADVSEMAFSKFSSAFEGQSRKSSMTSEEPLSPVHQPVELKMNKAQPKVFVPPAVPPQMYMNYAGMPQSQTPAQAHAQAQAAAHQQALLMLQQQVQQQALSMAALQAQLSTLTGSF